MAVGCRPTTKGYRFFGGDVHPEVHGELARKVVTSPVVDVAPSVENRRGARRKSAGRFLCG